MVEGSSHLYCVDMVHYATSATCTSLQNLDIPDLLKYPPHQAPPPSPAALESPLEPQKFKDGLPRRSLQTFRNRCYILPPSRYGYTVAHHPLADPDDHRYSELLVLGDAGAGGKRQTGDGIPVPYRFYRRDG